MTIHEMLLVVLISLGLIAVWIGRKWRAMREAEKLLDEVDKKKRKDLDEDGWDD